MTEERGAIRARSGPLLHTVLFAGSADAETAANLRRRLEANRIAVQLFTADTADDIVPNEPFVVLVLLSRAGSNDARLLRNLARVSAVPLRRLLLTLDNAAIPDELAAWERFGLGSYRGHERLMRHLWSIISRRTTQAPTPVSAAQSAGEADDMAAPAGFQGTVRLPLLEQRGQLRRLGRGRALQAWPGSARYTLVAARGGAALFDTQHNSCLWEIDAPVRCAALSGDGRRLALAGEQIWLWDVYQGRLDGTYDPPAGLTRCLAFSPDDDILVSGQDTGSILFWRTAAPERIIEPFAVLRAHKSGVQALAFSPGGRLLASSAGDQRVRLWNTLDRSLMTELLHPQANVSCMVFHPTADLLATGASDRQIRIWQLDQRHQPLQLAGHAAPITCLAFHPDGNLLASGSADGRLGFWTGQSQDGWTAQSSPTWHTLPAGIRTMMFSKRGTELALVLHDEQVHILQHGDAQPLAVLHQHVAAVNSLAFSPDGRTLAAGYADGRLLIRSFADRSQKTVLSGHSAAIIDLGFTADGSIVTTLAQDRSMRAWLSARGQQHHMLTLQALVHCGACARTARIFAVGSGDAVVRLWHADGQAAGQLRGPETRIEVLAIEAAGRLVAAGTSNGQVWLWEIASQGSRSGARRLSGHRDRVRCLSFTLDGSMLASGDDQGQLRIWRPGDGHCLHEYHPTNVPLLALAFSPDGNSLVAGDAEGYVWIWRRIVESSPHFIPAHAGAIHCLDFAPDGSALASGSSDGTVRIWALPETER